MAQGVPVYQEIDEPPRIGLTNEAADQHGNAKDETCVNKAEIIDCPEHNRS